MCKSVLSSCLVGLFLLTSACAADLQGDGDGVGNGSGNGSGEGSGGGDGNGGGDGDGSGGDNGDEPLPTVCELPSFAGGVAQGFYYDTDLAVEAEVFVDQEQSYSGLIIGIAQGMEVASLGPGSYTLSQAASFGDCNPCVIAMSGSETGELQALATAGTLQIDTLDPRVGGRFAGQVTGLQVVEVDASGNAGSCMLSVPDTSFDVTLATP